ncbi:hypothetical protein LP419_00290 [Massilia sp. H-1]|nr:hypothetical protein LP419_00290 [Massilia sp. H-1]
MPRKPKSRPSPLHRRPRPPWWRRPRSASNTFNPDISLVLGGTYARLSQDPASYRIGGFMPQGGEVGPGARSFNLGESELTFAANIDPMFSGRLTFALDGEDGVGVEEAFVQTRALSNGVNARAGRFLSSIGYLNSQHAHTWDFVDAPLAYQVFFGGQYKTDGLQAKWLAPTDTFIELGAEAGNGRACARQRLQQERQRCHGRVRPHRQRHRRLGQLARRPVLSAHRRGRARLRRRGPG